MTLTQRVQNTSLPTPLHPPTPPSSSILLPSQLHPLPHSTSRPLLSSSLPTPFFPFPFGPPSPEGLACPCIPPTLRITTLYLFLHSPQVHQLSVLCCNKSKEKYVGSVELLLSAARQLRGEVATMEVDILVGQNMAGILEKNRSQVEKATKELHLAAIMASGERVSHRKCPALRAPSLQRWAVK